MPAGTYYWQAWWKTIEPYSTAYSAVNKLVVAPYVKGFRGSITQYGSIPAVMVDGQYVTNIRSSKILCQIYHGKRVISKQSYTRTYNTIGGVSRFYCSNLKVSERLDGTRLRLKITFISGGKARGVSWTPFRAM